MIRSIAGILAGGILFALSLVVVDAAATALVRAIVPGASTTESVVALNDWTRALWLMWEACALAAAGYATAWIAARRPILHAVILGVLQALMTLWALLTIRDETTPLWFWIAGIAMMIPAAWVGGWLRTRHTGERGRS